MNRCMQLVSYSSTEKVTDELISEVINASRHRIVLSGSFHKVSNQKSFEDHRSIQIGTGCDYDYYVIALLTQFTDQVLDSFPFDKTMYNIWDNIPKEKIVVSVKRDIWCNEYKQWLDSRNIIFGEGADFDFF